MASSGAVAAEEDGDVLSLAPCMVRLTAALLTKAATAPLVVQKRADDRRRGFLLNPPPQKPPIWFSLGDGNSGLSALPTFLLLGAMLRTFTKEPSCSWAATGLLEHGYFILFVMSG